MRLHIVSLFTVFGALGLGVAVVHCVGETPDVPCEQYCSELAKACGEGADEMATPPMQFKSRQACRVMCGRWEKGDGGRTGNNLACRNQFVSEAKEEKSTDPNGPIYRRACLNAGPYSGACADKQPADPCMLLCRDVMVHCGTTHQKDYASEDDCMAKCYARFPEVKDAGAAANADLAEVFLTTKNEDTLGCRLYHLQNAVENGASSLPAHCPHTNVAVGTLPCGRPPADAGADSGADSGADAGADAPSDAPPG